MPYSRSDDTPVSELFTFRDALDALNDWQDSNASALVQRQSRRALVSAMEILSQSHKWSYLYCHGRVTTSAPYETGTIAFDYTGSTYEREVTLTTGTWPTWAADGVLRIDDVNYVVSARKSDTVLQLDVQSNPGADVTAGETYTLYRDGYVLPADFWTIDELYPNDVGHCPIGYVHPREWLSKTRYLSQAGTHPQFYTVLGSDNYQGAMELRLHPYSDSAVTLDFIYSRRPRQLVFEGKDTEIAGTVTNTAASATVSGTDTAFTSAMIGSVIRLATDASEHPTGREGANPFTVERTIIAVASTTSLTVDQAIASANTAVKYMLSDPIDIDVPLMRAALMRCAESQLGKLRRLEDRTALDAEWMQALLKAREADSRSSAPRAVGMAAGGRRLSDYSGYPAVDDEE